MESMEDERRELEDQVMALSILFDESLFKTIESASFFKVQKSPVKKLNILERASMLPK